MDERRSRVWGALLGVVSILLLYALLPEPAALVVMAVVGFATLAWVFVLAVRGMVPDQPHGQETGAP